MPTVQLLHRGYTTAVRGAVNTTTAGTYRS